MICHRPGCGHPEDRHSIEGALCPCRACRCPDLVEEAPRDRGDQVEALAQLKAVRDALEDHEASKRKTTWGRRCGRGRRGRSETSS